MTKIEELEYEVKRLSRSELAAFHKWFERYAAEKWDQQIEEDIRVGKLDKLAEEALAAHRAGRTTEL